MVEDHAAFREALASFLNQEEQDLEVVTQAGSLAEGRSISPAEIDVALIDIFRSSLRKGYRSGIRKSEMWPGVSLKVVADYSEGLTQNLFQQLALLALGYQRRMTLFACVLSSCWRPSVNSNLHLIANFNRDTYP
ncbi:MAG: hypothetical protein M3248_00200 [Actinomycetota bacterium]|nr:hypothetical protein [Actinomycetota bacterium]